MAVQAVAAKATSELITEVGTGADATWNFPEYTEIDTYTNAKCAQLMDELVSKNIIPQAPESFGGLSVTDKRIALKAQVATLCGEDPPAPEAKPETETKPSAKEATKASTDLADAVAPKKEEEPKKEAMPPATKAEAKAQQKAESKATAKPAPKAAAEKADQKPKADSKSNQPSEKGQVVSPPEPDPVASFATRIEKIDNRGDIENMVRDIEDKGDHSMFMLGGCLARLQAKPEWWSEEFQSYKDYVESVLGISVNRKGLYAISIYNKLLTLDIPWSAFGNIGWTKVIELLKLPDLNKDTVGEWVEKAKHMNALTLREHVEAILKNPPKEGQAPAEVSEVKTKTFKLHKDQREILDQALVKAKKEGNTEHEAVALEYIAQSYMGTGEAYKDWKAALTATRKKTDDVFTFCQQVFDLVESLCPELDIQNTIDVKAQSADKMTEPATQL